MGKGTRPAARRVVSVRLPPAARDRARAAAHQTGQSLQAFVARAVAEAADRVLGAGPPPTAGPWERRVGPALQAAARGGPGFGGVGRAAAVALPALLRGLSRPKPAREALAAVVLHADSLSAAAVADALAWWRRWLPDRLALVPARRRPLFAREFLRTLRSERVLG